MCTHLWWQQLRVGWLKVGRAENGCSCGRPEAAGREPGRAKSPMSAQLPGQQQALGVGNFAKNNVLKGYVQE